MRTISLGKFPLPYRSQDTLEYLEDMLSKLSVAAWVGLEHQKSTSMKPLARVEAKSA